MRVNKNVRLPLSLLILGIIAIIIIDSSRPEPVSWRNSFVRTDKIPFGSYVLDQYLHATFPERDIIYNKLNLYNFLLERNMPYSQSSGEKESLLILNTDFKADEVAGNELLTFVSQGNDIFLGARYFDDFLEDSLKLEMARTLEFVPGFLKPDSTTTSYITFEENVFHSRKKFEVERFLADQHFANFESSRAEILMKNKDGKAIFLKFNIGEGGLFLWSNPHLLTNYGILYGSDRALVNHVMAFLGDGPIIWDSYLREGKKMITSPYRYFLINPPLRIALYLSLLFLLLAVLFLSKRKQRVIPQLEQFENSSLEYADIISRLYLSTGRNRDLFTQKLIFFNQHLRSKYNINLHQLNKNDVEKLAEATGREKQEAAQLLRIIYILKNKSEIDDLELLNAHQIISKFY